VNTITTKTQQVPRPALIGIIVLVAAFAALMVVRIGVLGGSSSSTPPAPTQDLTPSKGTKNPTRPSKVVLLPGLPASIARGLESSKVIVVSLYVGQAPGDRPWVTEARMGAQAAGAGFVAVNVGADRQAASVTSFVGAVSAPTMLIVRRPGNIVTQISGPVERTVVAQAAHNAGARR